MAVPSGHPLSCCISRSRPTTARPSPERRGRCLCDPCKTHCSDLVHGVCVCVICQACTPEQWVLRTAHVPHQHLATVEPTCGTKQAWAGADPCPGAQLPGQAPALPSTEPGRGTTSPKPSQGGKVPIPQAGLTLPCCASPQEAPPAARPISPAQHTASPSSKTLSQTVWLLSPMTAPQGACSCPDQAAPLHGPHPLKTQLRTCFLCLRVPHPAQAAQHPHLSTGPPVVSASKRLCPGRAQGLRAW